ncbi:hypothetical protein NFI96_009851, partial [Prochilodus magdalenae]
NRTVMYAHSENASLRITEVNYTDSGLYYCCTQRSDYITFTNSTFLLVQDRDVLLFRNSSRDSSIQMLLVKFIKHLWAATALSPVGGGW